MPKSTLLCVTLIIIYLLLHACTQRDTSGKIEVITKSTSSKKLSFEIQNPPQISEIKDDSIAIREIRFSKMKGKDTILISDASHRLFLFVKGKFIRLIGQRGDGPSEYKKINSFSVLGDTVFILDAINFSIKAYSISTNQYISEQKDPKFLRMDVILFYNTGNALLINREIPANQNIHKERDVFIKVNQTLNNNQPTSVSNIDFPLTNLSLPNFSIPVTDGDPLQSVAASNTEVATAFVTLPYCPQIVIIDLIKSHFKIIETHIDVFHNKNKKNVNSQSDLEVMTESETIRGVYPLKESFALYSQLKDKRRLLFYTLTGQLFGEIYIPALPENTVESVLDVNEFGFSILYLNKKAQGLPYRIAHFTLNRR